MPGPRPTGQPSIDAEGVLTVRDDGSYIVSRVVLSVHGAGPSGPAVIDEAKRVCAYSNATRGNVITEVILT